MDKGDDEIMRRLQDQADAEKPMTVEFNGPGPFELPKCGKQVNVLVQDDQCFVLELQTEEQSQRLFVPISAQALPALKMLIDHALKNLGMGKQRH